MGGKKWPRQQYDASAWQQPSQSQSWQLWKGTNSPNWNKRRNQGQDWLTLRYDQMQVAPVQAEAAETGEDELSSMGSLLVKDVQRALTAARKADQKSRRVKQDILTKREQWSLYERQMKAAFTAQKKQFQQDQERLEHDLQEALAAGQQAALVAKETMARGCRPHQEAEDDSWDKLMSAGPDMEVEPSGFYEEALAAVRGAARASRVSAEARSRAAYPAGPSAREDATASHRGPEAAYSMEDLAGMARLQQMHFAASGVSSVAGPPPGLHPEQAHVLPPSVPPPAPPAEVYATNAHRDPYLTSPSSRAPPGSSPATTRSRTPRQNSRPRPHPYGQAEIPSDADLESRLRERRAAPDAPTSFAPEAFSDGGGSGPGGGIALRPFGRPLAPEGRNLLARATIEEDDDEDLAEEETGGGHPLGAT